MSSKWLWSYEVKTVGEIFSTDCLYLEQTYVYADQMWLWQDHE